MQTVPSFSLQAKEVFWCQTILAKRVTPITSSNEKLVWSNIRNPQKSLPISSATELLLDIPELRYQQQTDFP